MFSNLNATHKGMILVLVPVVIELAFVAIIANQLITAGNEFQRLHHVKTTLLKLHRLQNACLESFYMLMNKSKYGPNERQKLLQELIKRFDKPNNWDDLNFESMPELKSLIEDSEELRSAAVRIGKRRLEQDGLLGVSARENVQNQQELIHIFLEQQRIAKEIVVIEGRMVKHEPAELSMLRSRFIGLMIFDFAFNCFVSVFLVTLFTSDLLNRLDVISEKGVRLALGKPLSPPHDGRDELAEVDCVITDASNVLCEIRWTESAILDNSVDVICSLDPRFRFDTVGASSASVWGFHPDELLRKSILSLITSETIEITRRALEKIQNESGEGKFENLVRVKDGGLKNFLWTVKWLSENQNFYCVIHDTTELRNIEKLKKRFLAIASHDLRSPLNSIGIIFTNLITGKRGELSEGVTKEIERAQASSQRLVVLVNDFLELDKLEADKFSLELSAVCASEVCNFAKSALEGLSRSARVTITSPNSDAILLGDERRLVQVMINLLSNAIKFSPAGSTIRMSIDPCGEMPTITVIDEGPGIAPGERELIFDKFQQTRMKSAINMKGTGLGLAIVKNIVEAHGGLVGVKSELQTGSTFWIKIPRFPIGEDDAP